MKTQNFAASICGIPSSKVTAICKRMGGAFGGKETRSVIYSSITALIAYRLQRPCALNLERDIDMMISGQRHAFYIEYQSGCTKDGQLTYLEANLYSNGGFSLDLSQPVMDRALFHSDSVYKWPALVVRGRVCQTNQPSHTAYRGFGGPQGLFLAETVIQHLSEISKIPPDILRSQNFYRSEIDRTHFGQLLVRFHVPKLWNDLYRIAEVNQRRQEIQLFNHQNIYLKRGLAVIPTKFGINFTAKFMNQVKLHNTTL
jgi:xanthine dehydrogenase/oxidase